jgi:hypothetical protein
MLPCSGAARAPPDRGYGNVEKRTFAAAESLLLCLDAASSKRRQAARKRDDRGIEFVPQSAGLELEARPRTRSAGEKMVDLASFLRHPVERRFNPQPLDSAKLKPNGCAIGSRELEREAVSVEGRGSQAAIVVEVHHPAVLGLELNQRCIEVRRLHAVVVDLASPAEVDGYCFRLEAAATPCAAMTSRGIENVELGHFWYASREQRA